MSMLPPDIAEEHGPEIVSLLQKGLPPAVSTRFIAWLFGYGPGFIASMYRYPEGHYRNFIIQSGRKHRQIHAPRVGLKLVQKWIAFNLAFAWTPPEPVFGFVSGRSAGLAARRHCGAKWVYSVDIADFFPTTSSDKVASALVKIGYTDTAADTIARLCSFGSNLAQGSPASPVLSNIVFGPQDSSLSEIASDTNTVFTRYADDIVFSGRESVPEGLRDTVRNVITDSGWTISEHKDRLSEWPHRLKVHGLLVHGNRPRLTKGYRNRIRAFDHLLQEGKIQESDSLRIAGHLSYASSIDNLAQNPDEE